MSAASTGDSSPDSEYVLRDYIVESLPVGGPDASLGASDGEGGPIDWIGVVVSTVDEGGENGQAAAAEREHADGRDKKGPSRKLKAPKAPKSSKAVVIVGGVGFSSGGWGEYEAVRRKAEWEAKAKRITIQGGCPCTAGADGGPFYRASFYAGRTTIGGHDAAESLLSARRPRALEKAAEHLSVALGNLEDLLCSPDEDGATDECAPNESICGFRSQAGFPSITIPPLTSADLDAFVANKDYTSPDDLYALAGDAITTAASFREYIKPPPILKGKSMPALPARMVPVGDDEAVAKLEAAAVPYVTRLEELQSAVADILDRTATVVDKAIAKHKRSAGSPVDS